MAMPDTATIAPARIRELPDSTPLLADREGLRARWEADGVLFFRGAVGRAAVARVRDEYLVRLKALGVVDEAATEPRWNGVDRIDGARARPIGDRVWRDLVADPSLDGVVRGFLGEAPAWVPIVVHRSAPPLPAAAAIPEAFAARHQDGVFNYGIDFVTCWLPLMDIDDEVGGLAVAPGSHRRSLYPLHPLDNPGRQVGIPAGAIPDEAWRRPDYKAGDLLMFHSMTAHAGLPNRSDMFRLSMDIRFLPGSVARPLVGEVTTADGTAIRLREETGIDATLGIDEATIVRGPKGHPLVGDERSRVVFPGAAVIVVPGERGNARLIRSVSRKYVDLPASWYETLPADWVG